ARRSYPVLVGEGAVRFARAAGHSDYDPVTPFGRRRQRDALSALGRPGGAGAPDWSALETSRPPQSADGGAAPAPPAPVVSGSVAVLLRVSGRTFAGAVSDGTHPRALRGTAGPLAIRGAALYVGASGAVAVSGYADLIVRKELARGVHD